MNKRIVLVLLSTIVPFIVIFTTPLFNYTQDGWTHLARGAAFYKSLSDGQIPVRWVGDLNYTYGMPLFDFAFHLPYLLMSVFIFFGFGLVTSLKVITLISYIISGLSMYMFTRLFFRDEKKALWVTFFYQFFPYRFADMFVRGSIGEMFTFSFLPILLYGIVRIYKKIDLFPCLLIALGTAGIVLSHLATGGVLLLAAGVFALAFSPALKRTMIVLVSMISGLGLSAYYWIPALYDHKYTYGSFFAKDLFRAQFVPFLHFFQPNIFNDAHYRTGDVPIQIGLLHTVAIVVTLVLFFTLKKLKKDEKKLLIYSFSFLIPAFFIMQPISTFLWEHVPLFEQFQFPWRFLSIVGFVTSLLSVFLLRIRFFKEKYGYIAVLVLVVATTAVLWYPQLGFRKANEMDYWNYPLNTTYFGETDLIWSAGPAKAYPKRRVEVIDGKATIKEMKMKSNIHTYIVIAKTPAVVVDHTQFFPGWKVYVDGSPVTVQFQDPSHRGEITYAVPQGAHKIKVVFGETVVRLAADFISIFFLLTITLFFLLNKFFSKNVSITKGSNSPKK